MGEEFRESSYLAKAIHSDGRQVPRKSLLGMASRAIHSDGRNVPGKAPTWPKNQKDEVSRNVRHRGQCSGCSYLEYPTLVGTYYLSMKGPIVTEEEEEEITSQWVTGTFHLGGKLPPPHKESNSDY